MDSVNDFARKWTSQEEDVDTLSEWLKVVRSRIQIWITKLKTKNINKNQSDTFSKNPDIAETLSVIQKNKFRASK